VYRLVIVCDNLIKLGITLSEFVVWILQVVAPYVPLEIVVVILRAMMSGQTWISGMG
jgi:hypothetical protein